MEKMFKNCSYLKEVNLTNLKTDNVTSMAKMFYQSKHLQKVDLSDEYHENI